MRDLEQACEWLRAAHSVAVLTGAGISAESGIPTFRGSGGLWNNFRPEELATLEAFTRDPALVWNWYNWRRELIAQARPNAGHAALVRLEQRFPHFTVITQNVDGLHQRAAQSRVLEVHGSIWRLRCTRCEKEWADHTVPLGEPFCVCGGRARPAVVWFGESLPQEVWQEAQNAIKNSDVLLVAGTSAQVYPAAGLIPLAQSGGSRVVEINIETTDSSGGLDCVLQGPCGTVLPQLAECVEALGRHETLIEDERHPSRKS